MLARASVRKYQYPKNNVTPKSVQFIYPRKRHVRPNDYIQVAPRFPKKKNDWRNRFRKEQQADQIKKRKAFHKPDGHILRSAFYPLVKQYTKLSYILCNKLVIY